MSISVSVLSQPDLLSEILSFLPLGWLHDQAVLALAATCKGVLEATIDVGRFCVSEKYLDVPALRLLMERRVRNTRTQIEANVCLRAWRVEYGGILQRLGKCELSVHWNIVRDIEFSSLAESLTELAVLGADAHASCDFWTTAMTSLRHLDLSAHVLNLAGLRNLPNLESIRLVVHHELLNSSSALTNLLKLKTLDMHILGATPISFQVCFGPLPSLERLLLRMRVRITDWAVLATFKNLVSLSIGFLTGIQQSFDVSLLAPCVKLRRLQLDNMNIATLAPLASLEHLTALGLTDLRSADFSNLSSLHSLEKLVVENSDFEDLSLACKLPKLRIFSCMGSSVKSIAALPQFSALEEVNLLGCKIQTYSPLFSLSRPLKIRADIFSENPFRIN